MLKKIFLVSIMVIGLALTVNVYAQQSNCDGTETIVVDNDCASSGSPWFKVCCPKGYRVQGVAYNDLHESDYVDAVSPVCRSVTKGNDMYPADFQTAPVVSVCEKTENMVGIACKDMPGKGSGQNSDILDGCTAICENPTSKQSRMIYSKDLTENGRGYLEHRISLPNRVVGIYYKDGDWKGLEVDAMGNKVKGTDRADCATIVYKYLPIVQ